MMGAGQFLPCYMVVRVHRPDEEGDQGLVEFESLESGRTLFALLIIAITFFGIRLKGAPWLTPAPG